ncbi:hypothetical protein A6R68_11453, partial [Neotoma lepida]
SHDVKNGGEPAHPTHSPVQSSAHPGISQQVLNNKQAAPWFIGPQLPSHVMKLEAISDETGLLETPETITNGSMKTPMTMSPLEPTINSTKEDSSIVSANSVEALPSITALCNTISTTLVNIPLPKLCDPDDLTISPSQPTQAVKRGDS